MAESTIVKNMRDGTLTFKVGANSYEFKYEEGNFKLNIPGPTVAVYRDRGKFADSNGGVPSLRYEEDQPMSGSFSCYLRDITDGSYVTAAEFMAKCGQYDSAWGTSMGASGEVKTGTLQWDVEGTLHGDTSNHQLQLPYTVLTGAIEEGKPNMCSFSFTSYCVYPTAT